MPQASAPHVLIVGGGFSGALLAVQLARRPGTHATLIEKRSAAARGTAYSATHDGHLLNVRSGNMSAFPDDPGHFDAWLRGRGNESIAPGLRAWPSAPLRGERATVAAAPEEDEPPRGGVNAPSPASGLPDPEGRSGPCQTPLGVT